MRFAILLVLPLLALSLTACQPENRISPAERRELDCLASKIVVDLTAQVKQGLEDGEDAETLASLQDELTAEGLQSAKYLFPSKHMHQTYYEFAVARRTAAIQAALKDNDPQADNYKLMAETMDLGRECELARLPQ